MPVPLAAVRVAVHELPGGIGIIEASEDRPRSIPLICVGVESQASGFGWQRESVRFAAVLLCAQVEQELHGLG
jgi:hypothetical protein